MKQSDFTKEQQKQLDEAKEMVKVQNGALDEIREPLAKLAKDEKLSKRDNLMLATHLRWTDEEKQQFLDQSEEERQAVVDQILADPYVYFYVGHNKEGLNPTHRVYVTKDGVDIQDEDHPDF